MHLSRTIAAVAAVAAAMTGTSSARPAFPFFDPDAMGSGLLSSLTFLLGSLTGGGLVTAWRSNGLHDSDRPVEEQIAALSAEDRETLRRLRPRWGEEVTEDDKKFFSNCLRNKGATKKMAIKYVLPIATFCKEMLFYKKYRPERQRIQRELKREIRTADANYRRDVIAARRAERRERNSRNRNKFARATVAVRQAGRVLDAGLRRVFDPNFHPASAAAATARVIPFFDHDVTTGTELLSSLTFLLGSLAGGGLVTIWRSNGLHDSDRPVEEQIAALSADDRETLRRLRPRRYETVTEADKRWFSACLRNQGATKKMAIKYVLPIAVFCKQKLRDKNDRGRHRALRRRLARAMRTNNGNYIREAIAARRAERRRRNRNGNSNNPFARTTVALGQVGRMLDAGMRRVFDANFHPGMTAAREGAHASLSWKSPSPKLVEAGLQEGAQWLHALP
ncbi:MAG: hypothetical protein M1826_005070 [Phylliscum demangeonii]|nr:MAG: hypothetical protein M1826_005070 [Phylliscum demangeonii]